MDDEQIIIVDHGKGPVVYGGKPGPQGQAGEPLPQIQDQIDKLSQASLETQSTIWNIVQRTDTRDSELQSDIDVLNSTLETRTTQIYERIVQESQTAKSYTDTLRADTDSQIAELTRHHTADFEHIHTLINDTSSRLQAQTDNHTEAILSFIHTVQKKFTSYDNALAILTKTIAALYPSPYAEEKPEDPLDGETITTESGTWKIEQTYLSDGTIMLELDAEELLIDTLQAGDKVDYDGSTWTVQSKESQDGMIILTLTP